MSLSVYQSVSRETQRSLLVLAWGVLAVLAAAWGVHFSGGRDGHAAVIRGVVGGEVQLCGGGWLVRVGGGVDDGEARKGGVEGGGGGGGVGAAMLPDAEEVGERAEDGYGGESVEFGFL